MNSNKSANLLSRFLRYTFYGITASLLLNACNPYRISLHADAEMNYLDLMVHHLEEQYPFSGHKDIDWTVFKQEMKTIISGNQMNQAQYLQLRELFYSLPDARLNISHPDDAELQQAELGGYCGFDLTEDLDGTIRVIHVDSSAVAFQKGVRVGVRLLNWNGASINERLQNRKLRWGYHPAGASFREQLQSHFLSRGPIGETIDIIYLSETGNSKGIKVSYEEQPIEFAPKYLRSVQTPVQIKTNFSLRQGKIGVWQLKTFDPQEVNYFMNEVLPKLGDLNGLVIDLRENAGGHDAIAAQLAGYFVTEERLYEEILIRDQAADRWQDLGHLHAVPQPQTFTKPVVVLTGPLCIGPGEGFARLLQEENHVQTLGAWTSNGSFSYPGGEIKIPGLFTLYYPIGLSLDENGVILLESPGDYGGGVYPDIRIELSAAHLAAICAGYDLLLDEAINHVNSF